jgi:hypothetical protein
MDGNTLGALKVSNPHNKSDCKEENSEQQEVDGKPIVYGHPAKKTT